MKMRIVQKPSLVNNPDIFWYHAQVNRFGFWLECHNDLLMTLKYSSEMICNAHDTDLSRVEKFVEYAMRGEEMFPQSKNKIIKEYTS